MFWREKKRKLSNAALLSYMLKLSTRQFQQDDFVLPMYDMNTRQQVAMLGMVQFLGIMLFLRSIC